MEQPPAPAISETATALPIRFLQFKVALLLALTLVLSVAFVAYVLYARGVFETNRHVVLVTDDLAGVNVGMPVNFKGFAIGRVRRIELGADGKVRINIDVPEKNAHWLRTSSVFVIERSLVGSVNIHATSGDPSAAPLPDGATCGATLPDPPRADGAMCRTLGGDETENIPALVVSIKDLLANLLNMTAADSNLGASLGNVRTVTERMAGRSGVLGAVLGGEKNAAKAIGAIDRANALLESLGGVSLRLERTLASADQALAKVDQTLSHADQRVFGAGGVMDETQKSIQQLHGLLGDVRQSLKQADAVLADVQKISANARGATEDLAGLRAEVDASLRKVGGLIDEINRKWPFKRDTELKLP